MSPPVTKTGGGPVALALIAASLLTYWLAAVSGPSVVSHALPGGDGLPPYSFGLQPSAWLVVPMLWAATAAGAAGTWLALTALRRGWRPRTGMLLTAAAIATVAFALVPPVNSDDVYSYAAYGRMAALGRDPYTTAPRDLPDDPVARAVTPPWREEPTVYGPLATAQQAVVMRVAGTSVRGGVMALSALGALVFLALAGILHRYAADDDGRRRAALCWALNPLLLFQLVGGAHLDVLGVVAVLAATILLARATSLAAGAAVGAAIAIKLTGGVAAIGLAWAVRNDRRRLLQLVAGAAAVAVPLYLLAGGTTALSQVRVASRYVSHASWWRLIASPLDRIAGTDTSRPVISALTLAAFLAMSWLLWQALPPASPGLPATTRAVLAPTLAWLLTASYTLPWYAAWAWPLLALVLASRWDEILLAWTALLTIAYIPGRDVALPAGLAGATRVARAGLGPLGLTAILVCAVLLAMRSRRSAQGAAEGLQRADIGPAG